MSKSPFSCLILALIALMIGFKAVDAQQLMLPLEKVAQNADLIFVGTVEKQETRLNEQKTMIFTDVFFKDIRLVHATNRSTQKSSESVRLTYPGGQVGGFSIEVSHTPRLSDSHRYLIFMSDDGMTYANPIMGGDQGLFEVVRDAATGSDYLLAPSGKAVTGVDPAGVVVLSKMPTASIEAGIIIPRALQDAASDGLFIEGALPSEKRDAALSYNPRLERSAEQSKALELNQFLDFVTHVSLKSPIINNVIRRGSEGVFYRRNNGQIEAEPLKLQAREAVKLPLGDKASVFSSLASLGNLSTGLNLGVEGGAVGACGYQSLNIVMEQVPTSFWSYPIVNDNMFTWNQFMDIYRYTASDGTFGNNSQNEFGAFVTDATLNSIYGFHWNSFYALTIMYRGASQPECGQFSQTDVLWNAALSWTNDAEFALGNSGVVLLRSVNQHETGHVWGLQDGVYHESYDYDVATVMQPYYYNVVEDGWGIHRADAYLIRRQYQSQTGILPTRDVGVESYYASNGLNNATTDARTYVPGQSITLNGVTVENMSYSTVSDLRIRFFLSTNRIISTADYQLGGYWYWTSFNAESYNVANYTTTLPTNIPAGNYYVGAIVTINGYGDDDYTYNNATTFYLPITVTGTSARPNLTPYQPASWADKLVVSNTTGTSTDSSSLSPTDTLYVDWAVINNGDAATASRFYTKLYVDGVERNSWFVDPPLGINFYVFIQDYSIGTLSTGTHTIKIVTDANANIVEKNEADNEYTKTITIGSSCYTLTTNVSPSNSGTVSASIPSNCSGTTSVEGLESVRPVPSTIASAAQIADAASDRSAATVEAFTSLRSKAQADGTVLVIVGLRGAFEPEGLLPDSQSKQTQRALITQTQNYLLDQLSAFKPTSVKTFDFIPYLAMEVNEAGLKYLESSPDVVSIQEDKPEPLALAESVPLIGAPTAWASGFTGAGQTVAILDTGVDKTHPFLAGKVVSEGCYSSNSSASISLCPGSVAESTSAGSGLNCDVSIAGCSHGTHVAGIAAGKGTSFSGVAKDANIIAIKIFSLLNSGGVSAFDSDILKGLQRVQALSGSYSISAVNMSLGGGNFSANCDSSNPAMKAAIDSLRSIGIATVISSGNEARTSSMSFPACISSAVSVGSTDDGSGGTVVNQVSEFSNSASFLNLLAPGRLITSSVPGGGYADFQGTSMAAPHVAGAWAVLKSKVPSATVDQILSSLTTTGLSVTDARNGITKPRIKVDAALNALSGGGGGPTSGHYTAGTTVTLTPTPKTGYSFQSWTGCDSVSGNNCTVSISAARTVTANFSTTPPTRTLTVASVNPASSVSMTVSPNDNSGLGGGSTQFTRTYNDGKIVNLTAPSTAGGNNFQKWQRDGIDWATTLSTSVTMDANHTITAVYTTTTRIVRVVNTSAASGGTASVPVELVSLGNENSLSLSLSYDPAVLSNPQTVLGSGATGATLVTNTSQAASGRLGLTLSLASKQTFTAGTRQLLLITFNVAKVSTATNAALGFGDLPSARQVSDANAGGLSATYNAGTVSISGQAASVQFSAASYSVNEAGNFATITVTRTGNTSSAVTVDYLTSDGTAQQSRKYTTAASTLNFAAAETSKSFTVLIIDNAYVEGNQTVNMTLSNPNGGAILGSQNTSVLTIIDNDTVAPTTNPGDEAQFFVRQQYADFLNRAPDADGLGYWSSEITKCGTNASCIHDRRVGVADAFFFEPEFQQTGAYVYRIFKTGFGKRPLYAQFISDRGRVTTGAGLDQSKTAYALSFVQRDAFVALYPRSQTADQFLDKLLGSVKLNSGVDLAGMRSTLFGLYNGTDDGRAAILKQIADAQPLIDAEYNTSFVLMEYFGYLRRDPDAGGFDFWLDQVNKYPLRDVGIQHAMACSFITSAEYQSRFSSVITHTNRECPQ